MRKINIAHIVHQHRRTIFILLLVALILRLTVLAVTLPYADQLNDQNIFRVATEYFLEGKDFYTANIETYEDPLTAGRIRRYPYGALPTILFAGLHSLFGAEHFTLSLRFFYISIDLAFLFFLYVSAVRLGRRATLIGWLYTFNPLSILLVSYHGQLDVLVMFVAFLAWYTYTFSSRKLPTWPGLLLGLSAGLKLFTVLLWPMFVAKIKGLRSQALFTILTALPFLLGLLPLVNAANITQALKQTLGYSGSGSLTGITFILHTLAYLTSITLFSTLETLYRSYGKFLMLAAICLFAWQYRKKSSLIDGLAMSLLITYLFIPSMGVQYLYWFIPFYLLSSFFRLGPFAVQLSLLGTSGLLFYSMHAVRAGALTPLGLPSSAAPFLFSLYDGLIGVLWLGFLWLATLGFRSLNKPSTK